MRLRLSPKVILRIALVVAGAALFGWLLWTHFPNLSSLGDSFARVRWEFVALAIAWNLLSVLARALAWRTVIEQAMPPPRPGYRDVFAAFCVGLFANAVLPGRIGELARVAVLRRRYTAAPGAGATLVSTVFAHRMFDLPATLALVIYVFVAAKIPGWANTSIELFIALGLVLLLVALIAARRRDNASLAGLGPVRRVLRMARFGLAVMHEPVAAAGALLGQFTGWLCQLAAVYTAMRAFDIHAPLAAAALVLLLMNVATVFPLWPGNFGLVQAAIAAPLVSYGVVYAHGIAFGVGLQAIEASVGVGLGLLFLAREGFSYNSLKQIPQMTEEEGR
ncbi:MAG: phosphatidyl-myo-inositol alpha-mannosyltransferase [Gaiellaceae bacterium]|nr:phosphatidyl-myo-inositol alpha-mannosyltransferase [Gaiellaceae bacterium]